MTDIPVITALPTAPARGQDPAVFIQRADAFIDALANVFVAQLNAYGPQLTAAVQERVTNQAAASYQGASDAANAAIAARNAAQNYAASINPATLMHLSGDEVISGTKNFTGILQLAGAAIAIAATFPEASTAEFLSNVASRLVSARTWWNALVPSALVDAATIALDLNAGLNFSVTIAGNRVLGSPTNGRPGQQGSIFVTQDTTGGRVLSFGSSYVPDDLATYPILNPAAGAVTELRYKVAADGKVRIHGGKPIVNLRAQTITLTGSAYWMYRPTGAETVNVAYNAMGTSNTLGWGRANADGSAYASQAALGSGQSVNITLTADQILEFSGSSGGYVNVGRV